MSPQSSRSISVEAENATAWVPHGVVLAPSNSTSSTTGRVTSRTVRSPVTFQCRRRAATDVLLKVSVGYFSASKKSALRRCSSRWSWLVWMLAASMVTSTEDSSGTSATLIDAREGGEAAPHLGDHEVPGDELHRGVGLVEVVDPRWRARRRPCTPEWTGGRGGVVVMAFLLRYLLLT